MTLIEVVRGNITRDDSDAIVNAAHSSLLGGGGVDGAIHRAGGPAVLAACHELRTTTHPDGLSVGDAVATTAGELPARWVIHTVGPQAWRQPGGGQDLLHLCHTRSLDVAHGLGATSIAFPAISCGAYGWQPIDAAPIAHNAVSSWQDAHPSTSIERIRFVMFDDHAYEAFTQAFGRT